MFGGHLDLTYSHQRDMYCPHVDEYFYMMSTESKSNNSYKKLVVEIFIYKIFEALDAGRTKHKS